MAFVSHCCNFLYQMEGANVTRVGLLRVWNHGPSWLLCATRDMISPTGVLASILFTTLQSASQATTATAIEHYTADSGKSQIPDWPEKLQWYNDNLLTKTLPSWVTLQPIKQHIIGLDGLIREHIATPTHSS